MSCPLRRLAGEGDLLAARGLVLELVDADGSSRITIPDYAAGIVGQQLVADPEHAEVRAILTDTVAEPEEAPGLLQAIMDRFGGPGGVELDLPPRATRPRAAEFSS
jgi:hypothetical protein